MTGQLRAQLGQRADYTHRHNAMSGRHGWLRLTPAYSLKVVNEILASSDASTPLTVLDPFSGTATTALAASYLGYRAITVEINPFLEWFGRAKTATYDERTLENVAALGDEVIERAQAPNAPRVAPPPMHRIDKWWNPQQLEQICLLKAAIDISCPADGQCRDLLLVALCRTVIALSNVRFNHQSLSLRSAETTQLELTLGDAREEVFRDNLAAILPSAADNPCGEVTVALSDSRNLARLDVPRADLIITSPPYANRMSYIRELRPHMYWLGYLRSGRQAGELDWQAIGGTWGAATSRLAGWTIPNGTFESETLSTAVRQIASRPNTNGTLLANYVLKYFADIWEHLRSLPMVLNAGADVHYIVGNSSFYGVLVPVERIYAEMLTSLGFSSVDCVPLRKRNSNKQLFEFDVQGTWNPPDSSRTT